MENVCQSAPNDSEPVSLNTCCEGANAAPGALALDCLLIVDAGWRYVRRYVIGVSCHTVVSVAFLSACCDALSSAESAEHVGKTRWPILDRTVRLISRHVAFIQAKMTPRTDDTIKIDRRFLLEQKASYR